MSPVDCSNVRASLTDLARGALSQERARLIEEHIATCPGCTEVRAADAALGEALARLPRYAAPASLKSRLEADVERPPQRVLRSPARKKVGWAVGGGLGFALAATLVAVLLGHSFLPGGARDEANERLVAEATNDHLRILYAEHPLDIESGGIHQVKPWFAGKLDFAPVTAFDGDAEFPLQGGAVAYFVDRKAAALIYKRRLHTLSLFIFRAEGLAWPEAGLEPMGRVRARVTPSHGFTVILWRDGGLGYALVSDVASADLRILGAKIAGAP